MIRVKAFVSLKPAALFLLNVTLALIVITLSETVEAQHFQQFSTSAGSAIYVERCASCHGVDGKGDGPVAPILKVSPPDLTTITQRAGGTFPSARVVRVITYGGDISAHGTQAMPVWGKIFSTEGGGGKRGALHSRRAVFQLKRYLESIQRSGIR
jgi:mono/diheme cytochrome c family protein